MEYVAGLDIGSAFSKAVILGNGSLLAYDVRPTHGNFSTASDLVLGEAVQKAKLSMANLSLIGACGLGVPFISRPFTKTTELSSHSRGTHFLIPSVRTLIEVGNQSTRVIKTTPKGKVADMVVSDKCAAGSGRILQIIARVLKVDIEQLGQLSERSTRPAKFTTNCAVFLETEAISRVAEGTPMEDIIAGLHKTLAAKIGAMIHRLKIEADCVMTGGAALDSGLVAMMEKEIGQSIRVPEQPLITGAIGAALIALEKAVD
ncbi:MAG: acyl-CoA dehydratase activase [Syntrophobacteraceae bacterium]|jgi:predicted CoA-substrate-specific enzyme activase